MLVIPAYENKIIKRPCKKEEIGRPQIGTPLAKQTESVLATRYAVNDKLVEVSKEVISGKILSV